VIVRKGQPNALVYDMYETNNLFLHIDNNRYSHLFFYSVHLFPFHSFHYFSTSGEKIYFFQLIGEHKGIFHIMVFILKCIIKMTTKKIVKEKIN